MSSLESPWKPSPRYILRKSTIIESISHIEKSGTLLEIGFGGGDMLRTFSALGFSCTGLDFSEDARAYFQASNPGIPVLSDTAELDGSQFDVIAAFEVLEHIQDDREALCQWRNHISNDGTLILSVPCHQKKWGSIDVWAGHFRRYEREDMILLLKSCGFKDITIRCYGFPLTLILDPLLEKTHKSAAKKAANKSMIDRSKASGISRTRRNLSDVLVREKLFTPFSRAQKLFYASEFGSGYVVTAKKCP